MLPLDLSLKLLVIFIHFIYFFWAHIFLILSMYIINGHQIFVEQKERKKWKGEEMKGRRERKGERRKKRKRHLDFKKEQLIMVIYTSLPRQKLAFNFVSCWLGNEISGSRPRSMDLTRFKWSQFISRLVLEIYELFVMVEFHTDFLQMVKHPGKKKWQSAKLVVEYFLPSPLWLGVTSFIYLFSQKCHLGSMPSLASLEKV